MNDSQAIQDLSKFKSESLLDAIVQLTHAIHDTPDGHRKEELRARRQVAREEVLRRITRSRWVRRGPVKEEK